MSKSRVDERRIAELAKEPPRVLQEGAGAAEREAARRVVEVMALMGDGKDGGGRDREAG
jgi:hypothetical protein